MSKSSQDNAYVERVNRTIKEEYLDHWKPPDFKQLKRDTQRSVNHYNNKRIHNSLDRMSPIGFTKNWGKQKEENRKVVNIFNNELV